MSPPGMEHVEFGDIRLHVGGEFLEPVSIKLDVGGVDHLGPLGCFLAHVVAPVVGGRRRKIVQRLLMLAVVVIGAGAIAALVLAWSAADGRLRLVVKSTAPSPRTGDPGAMEV